MVQAGAVSLPSDSLPSGYGEKAGNRLPFHIVVTGSARRVAAASTSVHEDFVQTCVIDVS